MIYLLDTDTFVFMVRGLKARPETSRHSRAQHVIGERIAARGQAKQVAGHVIGLSAITVAELEFGARHSRDYAQEIGLVRRAMTPFQLLDFDAQDCAVSYGEVRQALQSAGTPIGALDTLIAAQALALGATLVTHNTAEFARVKRLRLENWAA
jgi:tRNA(fMet)-specific endonuclease VapC